MLKKFFQKKKTVDAGETKCSYDEEKYEADMKYALSLQAEEDSYMAATVKDEFHAESIDPWAIAEQEWDNVGKKHIEIDDKKYAEKLVRTEENDSKYAAILHEKIQREDAIRRQKMEEEDRKYAMRLAERQQPLRI